MGGRQGCGGRRGRLPLRLHLHSESTRFHRMRSPSITGLGPPRSTRSFDMLIHCRNRPAWGEIPCLCPRCVASPAEDLAADVLVGVLSGRPSRRLRPWLQQTFQSMLHLGLIFYGIHKYAPSTSWQGLVLAIATGGASPTSARNPIHAASQPRLALPFPHPAHTCSVKQPARAHLGCCPAVQYNIDPVSTPSDLLAIFFACIPQTTTYHGPIYLL